MTRFLKVAPGMPITDMARTIAHYEHLGFKATYNAGDFAILERGGVELHFARKPEHDPKRTATWIYVRVENVDQVYAELQAAKVEGLREVRDTDYKMRELPHIDPDGNLVIFGSPLTSR